MKNKLSLLGILVGTLIVIAMFLMQRYAYTFVSETQSMYISVVTTALMLIIAFFCVIDYKMTCEDYDTKEARIAALKIVGVIIFISSLIEAGELYEIVSFHHYSWSNTNTEITLFCLNISGVTSIVTYFILLFKWVIGTLQ